MKVECKNIITDAGEKIPGPINLKVNIDGLTIGMYRPVVKRALERNLKTYISSFSFKFLTF